MSMSYMGDSKSLTLMIILILAPYGRQLRAFTQTLNNKISKIRKKESENKCFHLSRDLPNRRG